MDLQKFIERMRYWCADADLGYDQSNRWDIRPHGECDCSSLVIFTLREAGFDTGASTYTGNISAELTKRGWKRLYPALSQVKPGDILLNEKSHVAVCVDGYGWNARFAQASIDESGNISGGKSGNQSGKETNIVKTYSYPWNCILRWPCSDENTEYDAAQPRYCVNVDGQWLPDMVGSHDTGGSDDYFAGILGKPIGYIAIDGIGKYRTKPYQAEWLPWIDGFDKADYDFGCAGDGNWISCIEIPNEKVKYRVHVLNASWLPWMIGNHDCGGSRDTFAGNGMPIDLVQIMKA